MIRRKSRANKSRNIFRRPDEFAMDLYGWMQREQERAKESKREHERARKRKRETETDKM